MKKIETRRQSTSRYLCLIMALTLMLAGLPVQAFGATEETVVVTDLADSEGDLGTIEVNQCFSYHTGINDGVQTLMQQFVANKKTAVMMMIPGSDEDGYTKEQAEQELGSYSVEFYAVRNGVESSNPELTAEGAEAFSAKAAFDDDCEKTGYYAVAVFDNGPDPGTYNVHWSKDGSEVAETRKVTFFETRPLNILIVPVKAYYSEKQGSISCKGENFNGADDKEHPWRDLRKSVENYLLDVYPVEKVNVTEAKELNLGSATYDLCDDEGMYNVWARLCKLQSKKKDGKDRYDLILGFIRDNPGKGGCYQGYTYGKPSNIITYQDLDMLPTVAHEIAHCYLIGDEYDIANSGSYNLRVNYTVDGSKGRDIVTSEQITTPGNFAPANEYWKMPAKFKETVKGSKKDLIYTDASALVVYLSLHPYSLYFDKFISWGGTDEEGNATGDKVWPTVGYMGSGNIDWTNRKGTDGYNWTTPVLWDHLLKQFATKSRKLTGKASSSEDGLTNADVFTNAEESGVSLSDADPIDDENDLLYGEDYRWGGSRMIEVYGTLNKDGDVDPMKVDIMFSYNGDLEDASVPDEMYKETNDIYTFAALNGNGTVITSPVDNNPAACEFYCSLFNPNTAEMQDKMKFDFNAEYPEGTKDFVIYRGKISELGSDGSVPRSVVWKMSDAIGAGKYTADIDKKFDIEESGVTYAEINSSSADVDWELSYDGNKDDLYTEIYYCPDGDDGEAIFIGSSDDPEAPEIKEGYIHLDLDESDLEWSRNAYVWIKATNGVNAIDLYSDEIEITLCNSDISLSGSGIKSTKNNDGEIAYSAEYTGNAIEPSTTVKAYDPDTGKYVSLKRDTDYSVSYENNIDVGTATVTVQGIGLYGGKNTKTFEIKPKHLVGTPGNIPDIKWSDRIDTDIIKYISLTDKSGKALNLYDSESSQGDFEVKYSTGGKSKPSLSELIPSDPAEKVPVTVTYSGKKNYEGNCKTTTVFNVLPSNSETKDLSGATVTLKKTSMPYTGKAQKPGVKEVVLDGVKLKSSDYSIVYSDNIGVGKGRVTVTGKNKYTGSAKADFTIMPKAVTSLTVNGVKNQSFTGEEIEVDELPITVKAGGITLVKDRDYTIEKNPACDYTNVTTKTMKKPEVVIKLKTRSSKTKSSDCPVVVWGDKVKDEKKTVTKTFSIIATKLGSATVDYALKSNKAQENKVMSADGTKQIGIIRNATKEEMKNGKYKFTHVIEGIEGSAEELEQNADLSQAADLMVNGNALVKGTDYEDVVKVSKTKDGKTGTITYKAKTGSSYTGNRVIRFMYYKYVQPVEQSE